MLIYSVKYSCSNCDHDFSKEFPRGKKADSKVECPNCGCLTGERDWPAAERLPIQDYTWPDRYPYTPWPYYYPQPEPPKPQWEWPKYDHKTTSAPWRGQELSPVYGGI